jgi:hypothetical protein
VRVGDGRVKVKVEGSTRPVYTGLSGGLEHLKIETRLIDERCASLKQNRGRGKKKLFFLSFFIIFFNFTEEEFPLLKCWKCRRVQVCVCNLRGCGVVFLSW